MYMMESWITAVQDIKWKKNLKGIYFDIKLGISQCLYQRKFTSFKFTSAKEYEI